MASSTRRKRLLDGYRFPGFRPLPVVVGVFGDPYARVVRLVRRSKKRLAAAAVESTRVGTTVPIGAFAICPAGLIASISSSRRGAVNRTPNFPPFRTLKIPPLDRAAPLGQPLVGPRGSRSGSFSECRGGRRGRREAVGQPQSPDAHP